MINDAHMRHIGMICLLLTALCCLAQPAYAVSVFSANAQSVPDVRITEVYPNPPGSDDLEWIEIKNFSPSSADIAGWLLDDAEGGSRPYVFPAPTQLGTGEYLVIGRAESKLALNNDQDKVRLISQSKLVVDEVSYGKARSAYSYAYDEQSNRWFWTAQPSPNAAAQAAASAQEKKTAAARPERVIRSFAELQNSAADVQVDITGIVIIPPMALSRQSLYLGEDRSAGDGYETLLQIYEHYGDFPQLAAGDRIRVQGKTGAPRKRARVKIQGQERIAIINSGHDITPTPLPVSGIGDDFDFSWRTVRAELSKINRKSFVVSEDDRTITIYPAASINFGGRNLVRGSLVIATGLVQRRPDRLTLTVFQDSDLLITPPAPNKDQPASEDTAVISQAAEQGRRFRQAYYLATLPAAAGLGWLLKRYAFR